MANRNRRAGINWELDVIKDLKAGGWKAMSSRYESKRLDDQGVDIVSDYPFKIQCKATVNQPNVHDLLTTTLADVIFYRKMLKQGTRFYQQGDYVMLSKEDFLDLVQKAYKKEET